MSGKNGPGPAPEPARGCCVCAKPITASSGRFIYLDFEFCVDCYEAGHRAPPPSPGAPPAA